MPAPVVSPANPQASGAAAPAFYLRNTGFFSQAETAGTVFTRQRSRARPNVNLAALPEPAP